MQNQQEWNALVPSTVDAGADFVTPPKGQGGPGAAGRHARSR